MPPPRRKLLGLVLLTASLGLFIIVMTMARTKRDGALEGKIANMRDDLEFMEAQYRGQQEHALIVESAMASHESVIGTHTPNQASDVAFSPRVQALLKNMSGYRAAAGVRPKSEPELRTPFVYHLLPYLLDHTDSLTPAFHMKSRRIKIDVVIGIPTVKRDKETYLFNTISGLIAGLTPEDYATSLIVVMIGEADLEFVINTARQIELLFAKDIDSGLIDVISPSASYYPDFDTIPDTLGDPHKRVLWRTKQNLDAIFLMAYAQSRGKFFLMLEDDVMAKKNYMKEIKQFTAVTTASVPEWFFIEYCHVGGIGKLFRSADLMHFITYVQLFYKNMPIDWLLESYLADKVCTIDKSSKACGEAKVKIRPKYKGSLFQHVGLYSSLKGKIQKIKDPKFGTLPLFHPHQNPPVSSIRSDIKEYSDNTLKRAYEGLTHFWGYAPKKGDKVEFWFEKPTNIERYTFRSGNVVHVSDKFYDTVVEVLPQNTSGTFVHVGQFDEFGLAEGEVRTGPVTAIRLRVNKDSSCWVVLSEIEVKASQQPIKLANKAFTELDAI